MFKKALIITMAALTGCLFATAKEKKMPEGALISAEYVNYDNSTNPTEAFYLVSEKNGETWLTGNNRYGEPVKVAVDKDILVKLREAIEKGKLYMLKDSYKTPVPELDDTKWSFKATFDGKKTISSSGIGLILDDDLSLTDVRNILYVAFRDATRPPYPEGELIGYKYEEYGIMAQPNYSVEVFTKDVMVKSGKGKSGKRVKKYFAKTINPNFNGNPDKRFITKQIPDADIARIKQLVKKHRMDCYVGSSAPKGLLDGGSWTLTLKFSSGEEIDVGGFLIGSNNDEGLSEVNKILDNLFAKKK